MYDKYELTRKQLSEMFGEIRLIMSRYYGEQMNEHLRHRATMDVQLFLDEKCQRCLLDREVTAKITFCNDIMGVSFYDTKGRINLFEEES
jgi:hypothetical protein